MAPAAEIPVIDLSTDGPADEARVARELVDAAVEHGFIYIRNNGADIPVEAVEGAFSASRRLFGAPVAEKQRCKIAQNRGWAGMHVETLDPENQRACLQVGDYKEAFNFGEFKDGQAQQPVPASIAPDQPRLAAFFSLCHGLCLKLNHLLGVGLAVDPPGFFRAAHLLGGAGAARSDSTLRLLYYPPLRQTDADGAADVRAGAHSDYGSLTLLFRLRGQAGLELRTRAGAWAPVPVAPPGTEADPAPPILVNIGDLLSYWTGGLLRSTVHRVVFPGAGAGVAGESGAEPRYSIAFFCHPAGGTPLAPVPSERVRAFAAGAFAAGAAGDGANPYAERKVLTADEHLQMRLRASYLTADGDGA